MTDQNRVIDPWFTQGGDNSMAAELSAIAEANPDLAPTPEEVLAADGVPEPVEPVVPAPVPEPVSTFVGVIELADGAKVTKEKLADGTFQATLDPGTGAGAEVFHGRSESELMNNVFVGKLNASRKIKELNKQLKLGEPPASVSVVPAVEPALPRVRKLTADENFELKTKLTSDPDAAFESWFEKKTGNTLEAFVSENSVNRQTINNIREGWEAKQFTDANEDYFISGKNSETMLGYLKKHGKELTTQNLQEAFDDLSEAGLLETRPEDAPAPVPAAPVAPVVPVPAAPAPTNERIVREERRSRAGLGIRTEETTTVPSPSTDRPPSDEGFRSLPPAELEKLVQDTLRLAASSRR